MDNVGWTQDTITLWDFSWGSPIYIMQNILSKGYTDLHKNISTIVWINKTPRNLSLHCTISLVQNTKAKICGLWNGFQLHDYHCQHHSMCYG